MITALEWCSPPTSLLELGRVEVHLWQVCLNQPPTIVVELADCLSSAEIERANHFHLKNHKQQFIVARAGLRKILSYYLKDTLLSEIEFEYQFNTKPVLAGVSKKWLQFNLSRSGDLAIYALSRERRIGTNLQQINPLDQMQQMADFLFTTAEKLYFYNLPPNQWLPTFYKVWNCKEAYLKALGVGLFRPMNTFAIAGLIKENDQPAPNLQGWQFHTFEPKVGYSAAFALEGNFSKIRYWQL